MSCPSVLVLAALPFLCAASPLATGDGWLTDFAKAKELAKKEGKDLLVDFTGSDWCGWCIKLNEEVFSKDHFKTEAAKNFVFVELDFPRQKKLDPELKKQNDELMAKFGVQGFPTILLLDGEGRPYAQTGYQPGGPEAYVTHLAELREAKTARDAAFAAAQKLEGLERAHRLVEGLDALPESLVVPGYGEVLKQIIALDADNKGGLKAKFEARIAAHELETATMAKLRDGDFDGAIAAIDAHIEKHAPEGEALQELLAKKVNPLAGKQDWDAVLATLDAIEKVDATTQVGQWAKGTKERVKQIKEQAAKKGDKDGDE